MTQIGENILVGFMNADDKKEKCTFKPTQEKWKANLDGSSTALVLSLGNKPHATSESEISSTNWPSQAHHLIPHLTLKKHPAAGWLKKTKKSKLLGDTYYDVDHKNNGKWLPYASSLPEWKATRSKTKRRNLMMKIMRESGLQLHQGRHSATDRYGVGEVPYKECVVKYLDKIKDNALSHLEMEPPCADCSGNSESGKVPPRENTVRFADKASKILWQDIKQSRIFVSKIAADFAESEGFD
jgi:hypothetical protein